MLNRKIYFSAFYVGLTACLLLCAQFGFGQTVQTITDKKDILIGEQIKLKIKVSLTPDKPVLKKWFVIPETIPHFDIVEKTKIDTVGFKDNTGYVEQTVIFTSFDSGKWVFPSLPAEFAGAANQSPQILQTDSFYVNVSYAPADSTNQLRDIKPIIKVSVSDYFWYYIIGGAILLLLIIFLLYRYFKKKRKVQPAVSVSGLSPYDEAMSELKKLEEFDLQDFAETKKYHIGLAEIFKNYMGRKQNQNLLNKTTGDLLVTMVERNLSPENISDLATALRCTDAVKFARYQPLSNESEFCKLKIKEIIDLTEQQILNSKS